MKTPTTLIIMDGFGVEGPSAGNAVVNASTPNLDKFFSQCPHSRLSASGDKPGRFSEKIRYTITHSLPKP